VPALMQRNRTRRKTACNVAEIRWRVTYPQGRCRSEFHMPSIQLVGLNASTVSLIPVAEVHWLRRMWKESVSLVIFGLAERPEGIILIVQENDVLDTWLSKGKCQARECRVEIPGTIH